MKFPITHGDTFSETFSGVFENFNSGSTAYRSGNITINADAYGTLILPNQQFNDVLKITTVNTYQDSISSNLISQFTDTLIYWYDTTIESYLARYGSHYIGNAPNLKQFQFIGDVTLSLKSQSKEDADELLNIFPNPANDFLTLEYSNAVEKIQIIDMTGKIMGNN